MGKKMNVPILFSHPAGDLQGAMPDPALRVVLIVQICGESQTNVDDPSKQ